MLQKMQPTKRRCTPGRFLQSHPGRCRFPDFREEQQENEKRPEKTLQKSLFF